MDYSTYAQLSGIPYMTTPDVFYPQMSGGMQEQKQCDGFQQGSNQDYQTPPVPDCYQYRGQGQENKSDGFRANPYDSGRQYTASEYRCMAREQKRAREMRSRNGLYSPFEDARYSGGDASQYPNYTDGGKRMESQSRNPYW